VDPLDFPGAGGVSKTKRNAHPREVVPQVVKYEKWYSGGGASQRGEGTGENTVLVLSQNLSLRPSYVSNIGKMGGRKERKTIHTWSAEENRACRSPRTSKTTNVKRDVSRRLIQRKNRTASERGTKEGPPTEGASSKLISISSQKWEQVSRRGRDKRPRGGQTLHGQKKAGKSPKLFPSLC